MIEVLLPQARTRVLSLLLLDPHLECHLREVARRCGVSVSVAARELRALAGAGLLQARKAGNRTYYRANKACPVYSELSSLLAKTAGLAEPMRKVLRGQTGVELAFIYGSAAQGKEKASSDVDLMVVGEASPRDLSERLSEAETAIGREINAIVMTGAEARQRVRSREHFMRAVLRAPKLFLVGDEDVLRRVVG